MRKVLRATLAFVCLFSAVANSADWMNDPVIASEDCSALEYKNIVAFLTKYYYPKLGFSASQNLAGKEMMETYAIATSLTLRSQTCLSEALNLKKLTDKLKKEQALISSGTTMSKKQIKKQRKFSEGADKKIKAAAEDLKELTPKQRKTFSLGAATYLAGAYTTAELFKTIKAYAEKTGQDISDLTGKAKKFALPSLNDVNKAIRAAGTANTIRVVTSGLPPHASNLMSTSQFLMKYSKRKNIKLPSDATNKLNSASDWI